MGIDDYLNGIKKTVEICRLNNMTVHDYLGTVHTAGAPYFRAGGVEYRVLTPS